MKRLLAILLCITLAASCVKDTTIDPEPPMGGDGFIEIPFGHRSFSEVEIETRAALPSLIEARVTNVYVLIFDSGGERVYGQFFDSSNRSVTKAELEGRNDNTWWVENLDPEAGDPSSSESRYTYGCLRMKVPEGKEVEKGHIYLIANLDEDLINISEDKLGLINREEEIKTMVGVFNQQSTSRTGLFLMTGYTGINILNDGRYNFTNDVAADAVYSYTGTYDKSDNVLRGSVIKLERLDAKITVKVGVLPGYLTRKPATMANGDPIYDADGNQVWTSQAIADFIPSSWQVVNLPNGSWLLPRKAIDPAANATANAGRGDAPIDETGALWSSNINTFETIASDAEVSFTNSDNTTVNTTRTEQHFSFYMLENRQSPNLKASVSGTAAEKYLDAGIKPYHLRDKLQKNAEGEYIDKDGNIWEFAPEGGTYLIIKGEVTMEVHDSDSYQTQTMNALVTYYIHLGAFGKEGVAGHAAAGLDNYDICRNTHYTYTINIKGVRQIEVEVATDAEEWKETNEAQSGNTGDVYLAQESIHTFDAHYGQRVFRFNADAIMRTAEADRLTWYVQTPFGRSGVPERVGPSNVEVPTDLDYKWVHFALNRSNGTISMTEDGITAEDKRLGTFNKFVDFHENGTGAPSNQRPYTGTDGYFQYSQENLWYPGEGAKTKHENPDRTGHPELMNVMELCDLLREQMPLYKKDKENWDPKTGRYKAGYTKQSIFDEPLCYASEADRQEAIAAGDDDDSDMIISRKEKVYMGDSATPVDMDVPVYRGGNIYITAFVDEFYYDFHPISGNEKPDLWRQFVHSRKNQMRMMHVLCDAKISADGASSATGSVVTIRQRPIQTIYESDTMRIVDQRGRVLNEAWGCETIDETRSNRVHNDGTEKMFFNNYGTTNSGTPALSAATTTYNGRYNTYLLWQDAIGANWDNYLEFVRVNDYTNTDKIQTYWLKDGYQNLRYSCLMRNRDNDGNGVIDKDEVRWYMASSDQLVQLYIGELGVSGEGQLYSTYDMDANNFATAGGSPPTNYFRSHVVTSDMQIIWAEEGCSISGYLGDGDKEGRLSIRCVRNLGTETSDYELTDKTHYPPSPISVTSEKNTEDPGKTVYKFDLSNLSYQAKRNYSVHNDLTPMDELSESAMPYSHFETGDYVLLPGVKYTYYPNTLYDNLNKGLPTCPAGYRVPNIREMVAIKTLITDSSWWVDAPYFVCNYYSFGAFGNGMDNEAYSWAVSSNMITVGNANSANINIRCIKDVTADEL